MQTDKHWKRDHWITGCQLTVKCQVF